MKFTILSEICGNPLVYIDPKTLGQHLANWRSQSNLLQKEAAIIFGCCTESFARWEQDESTPLPHCYPKIIEELGYLPEEDLSTYHGYLRSRRLRLGLTMPQMAKRSGAHPANWTRWERGIYVPAIDFIRKLSTIGIDLSHFNLHGDIVPTPLARALRKARKGKGYSHKKMSMILGFKSSAVWHRFELQGIIPREEFWGCIERNLGIDVREI